MVQSQHGNIPQGTSQQNSSEAEKLRKELADLQDKLAGEVQTNKELNSQLSAARKEITELEKSDMTNQTDKAQLPLNRISPLSTLPAEQKLEWMIQTSLAYIYRKEATPNNVIARILHFFREELTHDEQGQLVQDGVGVRVAARIEQQAAAIRSELPIIFASYHPRD